MTITFALSAAMSFAAGFSVDLREDAMTTEKELLVYTVGNSVSDGLIKYDPALVISIHDPSVDDAGHVRFAAKDISIYVKIKTEGMKRGMDTMQYKVGEALDWSVCYPDRELNARMVNFDLNYFKYDFLKLIPISFNEIRLQDDIDRLCRDAIGYEGNTFMYRDFQARNVMIRNGHPCFIDFQGGRRGPVQYDLASFLWNAGTHFGAELRSGLEEEFVRSLEDFVPVDREEFGRRYRLMTLVRLLQETAAYGFRGMVERKQLFIDCIPAVVRSLGELGAQCRDSYPYLADLMCRISEEWDGSTIIPGFSVQL